MISGNRQPPDDDRIAISDTSVVSPIESWNDSIAVIPVRNEASTIATIVVATRVYMPVIVVDDASADGSGQRAAEAGASVLTLPTHQGKGAALQYGFREALRRSAESVVTLDGDGQHDPQDIPRLLRASRQWPGTLIIGGRLETEDAIPRHRLHAIQVASFWISWMGFCNLQDTQSGFRVYPASILQSLPLKHGGFLLESEILLKAAQSGCKFREIPIQAVYVPGQRSQYRPLRDGTIAVTYLLYRGMRFWLWHIRHSLSGRQRDPRAERAYTWGRTLRAMLAMGLLPVLLLAVLMQCLVGHFGYDMIAPIIRRFYDQRRLPTPNRIRKAFHGHHRHDRWEFI